MIACEKALPGDIETSFSNSISTKWTAFSQATNEWSLDLFLDGGMGIITGPYLQSNHTLNALKASYEPAMLR